MNILDFTFNGKKLSDFECICCNFDSSSGTVEVSAGADVTLNQERPSGSNKFNLYSTSYDEPFTVGKYLLIGTVAFTSNKAGRVGVRITEGGNVVPQATTLIPGLSGSSANLTVQVQWIFNVTENTTYRLQAFQTSGGNLSVTGYLKSVCLS